MKGARRRNPGAYREEETWRQLAIAALGLALISRLIIGYSQTHFPLCRPQTGKERIGHSPLSGYTSWRSSVAAGLAQLKKNPAEAGQGEPCYGFESERGVLKYLLIYSIPHCRLGGRGPHAPDGVADIVGDQQTAGPIDRDADRAAECLVVCVDEAGEDIRRLS
jgi:hypothetical protein